MCEGKEKEKKKAIGINRRDKCETLGEEVTENDRRQGQENEGDCVSTEQQPGCSLEIMTAPIPDLIFYGVTSL